MKKVLTAPRENRCIGCGLCTIRSSILIADKIDLSKAFIRIAGKPNQYKILIDYGINPPNLEDIVKICPKNCFEIIEKEDEK